MERGKVSMSCHRSQKSINLHHDQINAGRDRRLQHQVERLQSFLNGREEARFEYNCALVFGFIYFSYIAIATAVYTRYILL